jgi:hypothetical protein
LRVAQGSQTAPLFPENGGFLSDMIARHLFHGKRHLVSHTLQRIDVLIKTPESQIFRVRIADLNTQENADVRRSVLHREF